ncbi:hypothetical protein [Enterococcus faecium]|uniref:hypothetical protein n=1 Tax=Enterococcus faecium TaxID=1352 RepID=UPI001A920782|nr:hypothetical protein [Enterococcus faecium]EME7220796.1 hypothetical protein [Enterococcus faecium]
MQQLTVGGHTRVETTCRKSGFSWTIEEVPEVIRKNVLTILQNLKQEGGTYD